MSNHVHPFGELIHQQHDEFGRLDVVETATARSLYFGSEVEQCRFIFDASMRLPLEYQQVMEAQILAHHQQNRPVQRILMLGMGGGSIARQLNMLLPNASIHIVELRQAVIDIAYDYFELPNVPEDYVHRIGRTGRAGREGKSFTLTSPSEKKYLGFLTKFLGKEIELHDVPGQEARKPVQESRKKETPPKENKTRPQDSRPKKEQSDRQPEKSQKPERKSEKKPPQKSHRQDQTVFGLSDQVPAFLLRDEPKNKDS
ncbi:MAG: hypothetical protein L3J38_01780 [Thiomicrorhabdus sp.]|nr:hypothetical protein [Thiomicrorhabdus sp.]